MLLFLQDNDFHFPEVLVKAANMLLENTGFQKALNLEEGMRKNSFVNLAVSTAKTILYYMPVVFVTRYESEHLVLSFEIELKVLLFPQMDCYLFCKAFCEAAFLSCIQCERNDRLSGYG